MVNDVPRKLRLGVQFQRELADLINHELTDPRVEGVSITAVDISQDLRNATILVSLLGTDDELADGVTALNGAAGRLRRGISGRLKLRVTPQLHFRPDSRLREADRVAGLIRAAVGADRKNATDRGETPEES